MHILHTAAQMRQMDHTAMEGPYQIAPAVLMENAGRSVVEKGGAYLGGWTGKDVLIVCGKGNNGGDGFVIARHLLNEGARAYVYVLGKDGDYKSESQAHLHTLRLLADGERCIVTDFTADEASWALLKRRLSSCDVVIDAMVGTGFYGNLREPVATIVNLINEEGAMGHLAVVAVDMPTGVNADTGAVSGDGEEEGGPVFADVTVTFGAMKRGLVFYPGKTCAGDIFVEDIGMPLPLLQDAGDDKAFLLDQQDIAEIVTPRSPTSHKGTHGTIGIVAGSSDMAGAALMAAHGAVRAGAGKVFLRIPGQTAPYCIGRQEEVMVRGVGEGSFFTGEDAAGIIDESRHWSVLAIGPGLGRCDETAEFVKVLIAGTTCPVVIDADGLYALAQDAEFIAPYGSRLIMTPHLGEFSRLSGRSVKDINGDLIGAAKAFVAQWHVNLVLKGAPTVIVSARTGNAYINPTGNAGMACGGMGDILTGVTAAMAVHAGMSDLLSAACAAVYLHGAAGDKCSESRPYGFTPMEVADAVPSVIKELEENLALPVLQRPLIVE